MMTSYCSYRNVCFRHSHTSAPTTLRFDAALADVFLMVEEEEASSAAAAAAAAEAEAASDRADATGPAEAGRRVTERAARRVQARAAMHAASDRARARHRMEGGGSRRSQDTSPTASTPMVTPAQRTRAGSARSAGGSRTNEALMHELLMDPDWRLSTAADATAGSDPAVARVDTQRAIARSSRISWGQTIRAAHPLLHLY
jgi:hypothetical protein